MGLLVIVVVAPLNLLVRLRPADIGQVPDGKPLPLREDGSAMPTNIVDPVWAGIDWTVSKAIRTPRFWWLVVGFFCSTYAWYAVQVHQTTFLIETGFDPILAAWALGLVSIVAIPGQIGLGALSDKIGRESVWSFGCMGFIICYAALIALEHEKSHLLLYVMVIAQGCLGYAITSVLGPIVAEIFEGPHYGAIFGILTVALIGGGAAGPWVTGITHDATGSYQLAFFIAIGVCILSIACIWIAAPRKVRMVPGRIGSPL
ncbi:MAG: MFS transporter [Minwuia sp.]|nr:MFS transporter [Minwuia sp.]